MYTNLLQKSEEILKLYKEGKLLNEIAKQVTSSTVSVKKVLLHYGIDYKLELKKSKENTLVKAIGMYQTGISQSQIEKELKITRKTLRELLKSKDNIEYRSKSEQQHIRCQTQIDHTAFDELTPEALYWLGMLYSDGHIEEEREASIDLTLHDNDKDHLIKFQQFLKSDRPIVKGGSGDCLRIRVNSKNLRNKLVALGFTHNKSTTICPHDNFKLSRDFWRGVIDGGVYNYSSLGSDRYDQLYLCGTLTTIIDFIDFCTTYNIKKKYPSICRGKNLYQVSYYGEDAHKIAEYLYKDSTIYLERKYKKYLSMLEK